MAKITVSQRHVDAYPELADQLGKTVDASVIQTAASKNRSTEVKAEPAKVAAAPKKKAAARKAAPKKKK